MLLDSVVGEVNHAVADVREVIFFGGGADVAVIVPITLQPAIDCSNKNVAADVELAVVDKEALLKVFLHYYASSALLEPLLQFLYQFLTLPVHADAESPVGVLTRLDNPQILLPLSSCNSIVMRHNLLQNGGISAIEVVGDGNELKRVPLLTALAYKYRFRKA